MQTRKDFLRNSGITFAGILLSNQLSAFTNSTNDDSANKVATRFVIASNHCSINDFASGAKATNQIIFDENNVVLAENLSSETISKAGKTFDIVQQNGIKVGIVTVSSKNDFETASATATLLKDNHNCTLVICVSSLGFKNKNNVDDLFLANQSKNIDTILSTDASNYCKYQYVALNGSGSEVYIVNNINDNKPENSFVAIDLDKKGNRQAVAFA